jgi:hypothetical protein
MTGWELVPCLARLHGDFDRIAPTRDRRSDGTIGDAAHRQTSSDHNPDETGKVPIHDSDRDDEVHALDVDADLRTHDLTMGRVVAFLVDRCRTGRERRLRYIIYNRVIWSESDAWRPRPYTGPSPHTEHAHFSASYDRAREASTATWNLEEIPVALTAADKEWIAGRIDGAIRAAVEALPAAVWNHTEPDPVDGQPPRRTGGDLRMMDKRARDRHAELLARFDELPVPGQ